jgi:hypothetical protein
MPEPFLVISAMTPEIDGAPIERPIVRAEAMSSSDEQTSTAAWTTRARPPTNGYMPVVASARASGVTSSGLAVSSTEISGSALIWRAEGRHAARLAFDFKSNSTW